MNYFVRKNYQPSKKSWGMEYTYAVSDFSGGLNNRYAETKIDDKQVVDCKNMMFEDGVMLAKRNGIQLVSSTPLSNEIEIYAKWEAIGATITVSGYDAVITKNGVSTTKTIWNQTGVVRGDKITGCEHQGCFYIADGHQLIEIDKNLNVGVIENASLIQNVTVIAPWQADDPETPEEGTYRLMNVRLPFGTDTMTVEEFGQKYGEAYESSGETYYSGAFTILKGYTGGDTSVAFDWTTHPTGEGCQFKLTTTTGGTTLMFVARDLDNPPVIGDNAPVRDSFIYMFQVDNPSVVEGRRHEKWDAENNVYRRVYEPCEQELTDSFAGMPYIPDKPQYVVTHKGRLCVIGDSEQPNAVFLSRTNQPWYFATSGAFITPHSEPLNNMFVFDNSLVIGGKTYMYALYGSSEGYVESLTFKLTQMDTTTGFMGWECGDIIQNYYLFLGADKKFHLLATPTTNVEYLMIKDAGDKIDLEDSPFQFGQFNECSVQAVSKDNYVYFNIRANNWNCIVAYNYTLMAFTYFTGFNATRLLNRGDYIYFTAANYRIFRWMPQTTEDNRSFVDADTANGTSTTYPIDAKLVTKRFMPYGTVRLKNFKQLLMNTYVYRYKRSHISGMVGIDDRNIPFSTVDASNPYYGSAVFGESIFPTSNRNFRSRWNGIDFRGSTIQFTFTNNIADEGLKIIDITAMYKAKDVR